MADSYTVLDDAERTQKRVRQSEDLTGLGTGSSGSDLLAAGLFALAAFSLLVAQNVILFTLAFLAFAFMYNPVRVRTGQTVARDTTNIF